MPDDGIRRWLIDGQLRERPWSIDLQNSESLMTIRNSNHSSVMSQIAFLLVGWRNQQPEPHGKVYCGEAGCRLSRNPDTTVGVDVMYVSAAALSQQTGSSTIFEGTPTLVVEILSPSTTQEALHEKIRVYRRAGVPLIWVVDPDDQTIRIYRPQGAPTLATGDIELVGDPHMPGLRIPARELFV